MNFRTGLVVLVLVLIAVFAALNWTVLMAPTDLSLAVAHVNAPLGLIMLGLIVLLAAVFLIYIVVLQAGMMAESRRIGKELKTQRELAEKAEASRFDELRTAYLSEMQSLNERIDRLDRELRATFDSAANGVNATLGEIDDRLRRESLPAPQPQDAGGST